MSKITNPSQYQPYNRYGDKEGIPYQFKGITLRQYYAGLAMQGICSNSSTEVKPYAKEIAFISVELADALINELNKPQQ
jgi:hypothetical protein